MPSSGSDCVCVERYSKCILHIEASFFFNSNGATMFRHRRLCGLLWSASCAQRRRCGGLHEEG